MKTSGGYFRNAIKAGFTRGRLVGCALLAALAFALGLFIGLYHWVTPWAVAELGAPLPPATAFFPAEGVSYEAGETCREKGLHLVTLVAGKRRLPCLLLVRDTTPPRAKGLTVTVPCGQTPGPEAFIGDLVDEQRVGVSFAETYDFSQPGEQEICLFLRDESGNRTEVTARAVAVAAVEAVTLEAGSPVPTAAAFCREGFHGELTTLLTEAMLHTPGVYPVELRCAENGLVYPSALVVADTVAPTAQGKLLAFTPGDDPAPEAFLTDIRDETALTFAFVQPPRVEERQVQAVVVAITDAGRNRTEVLAQALISDQRDTAAPNLTLQPGPFYLNHPQPVEALVTVGDDSGVYLAYVDEPDWQAAGEQTFSVRATDLWGNEAMAVLPLTLLPDTEPPVLYGVTDKLAYVNEPIAYLQEVRAEDALEGPVPVEVDSRVILTQTGAYAVTFSAKDSSGNLAQKTVTYTLIQPTVTEEQVRTRAREILAQITTEDMVPAQKLRAVFDHIQGHMRYAGSSDKTDWRKEALRGMNTGRGDCFTYYAYARALLEELNIPFVSVTRLGGATRHYWMLVNLGTGWYHFDTINYYAWNRCFMWTRTDMQDTPAYFWRYAEGDYPPLATAPFDYALTVAQQQAGMGE